MRGYILLPRSLRDQRWYSKPTCRLLALHLLQEVSFRAAEHPKWGYLPAGTHITTYRCLAEEVGMTLQNIRTALRNLESSGFVTIEAFTKAIKIVITWPDFVSLRDGGIMLSNTIPNTIPNTMEDIAPNTISEIENSDKSISCEDLAQEPNTKHSIEPNTTPNTTPNTLYKNKDKLSIINTHTNSNSLGITKSAHAPARGAHAQAPITNDRVAMLLEWIEMRTPEFLQMEVPFTQEQLGWMCATFSMEKLKRVLSDIASKRSFDKHRFAFNAFSSFLRYDKERGKETYSYEEVCDAVAKGTCKIEDFILIHNDGPRRWLKV